MTRLALMTALFAIAPWPAASRADELPAPIKVPFEMLSNGPRFSGHIAVQVRINGKGPFRLIFDTGAPTMLLTTKVAKEAGLLGSSAKKPSKKAPLLMPGQVTIDTLEAGGAKAKNLPAVVLDHPTVAAIAEMFGPIEGIVGFPFFARFRMSIDYQARELTLVANNYEPADVLVSLMTTLMARSSDRGKTPKPRMLVPAGQWGMEVAKTPDDNEAGVEIAAVFAGGAAAKAGLKVGDRLLTIDGRWTDTVPDTFTATATVKPGKSVVVVIRRDGSEQTRTVIPVDGF